MILGSNFDFWNALKKLIFLLVAIQLIIAFIPQLSKLTKDIMEPKTNIAWINLSGEITESASILNEIRFAAKDESVKAVLLKINSGGGATGSSEMLYRELCSLRNKKPVVAFCENVCASGAYLAAVGCSRIFALDHTIIGSIGVCTRAIPNIKKLLDSWNIDVEVLSKGEYKLIGHPTAEKMSDKTRKHLQSIIDGSYDLFVDIVAKERSINKDNHKNWANGKIFLGHNALTEKLIDEIGSLEDVEIYLKKILSLNAQDKLKYTMHPKLTGIKKLLANDEETDLPEPASFFTKMKYSLKDFLTFFFTAIADSIL